MLSNTDNEKLVELIRKLADEIESGKVAVDQASLKIERQFYGTTRNELCIEYYSSKESD